MLSRAYWEFCPCKNWLRLLEDEYQVQASCLWFLKKSANLRFFKFVCCCYSTNKSLPSCSITSFVEYLVIHQTTLCQTRQHKPVPNHSITHCSKLRQAIPYSSLKVSPPSSCQPSTTLISLLTLSELKQHVRFILLFSLINRNIRCGGGYD